MSDYKYVGTTVPRLEGRDKVTGEAQYGDDINQPRQLYAAVLRSPHPHATILNIDTSEAEKRPGVRIVITGKDMQGVGMGHYDAGMPVLAHGRVLYEGEPVAAVAAETIEQAHDALHYIKVNYEPLKPILNVEESMTGEILLQDFTKYTCHPEMFYEEGTNIAHHFHLVTGDVEKGFENSEYTVEGVYETACVQHVCIESHVVIAKYQETTGLTIWGPMQSPFFVRGQLCRLFKLPYNKVRMIISPIGGGFGNKWELRAEPIAAALALKSNGRPVKLLFSRHDEFLGAYVRGGQKIWIKSGVNKDGTLVARKIRILADTGAYVTSGPRVNSLSSYGAAGPYHIQNLLVDNYTLLTNKQVTSAYRGFGVAEVSWANENHMDEIANVIGMDRVELRLKNIWQDGDTTAWGEKLYSVGAKQCLEEAARLIEWDKDYEKVTPEGKLRGRGIACTCKITGTPSGSSVICKLNEDGTVNILKSGTDMGQGNDTITAMFFSEAFGIDINKVTVTPVDTLYTPYEKSATGSRLTHHMGPVLKEAAEDIHGQLAKLLSKKWNCPIEEIKYSDGMLCGHDESGKEVSLSINEIGTSKILTEQAPIIGRGTQTTLDIWDKPDRATQHSKCTTSMWMWSAQACEALVDPETGMIEIEVISAAHDVGQIINEDFCRGNVEGGVLMGLGHTLLEEMQYDKNGKLLNPTMLDFKVPTAKDTGYDLRMSLVECAHPRGAYGAKGFGECTVTPTPAAVGNAIAEATGVRMTSIPIKADDLYLALKAAKTKER